jgi:hypothetical protein
MFEDDPQSELTLETYNRLKRAYDRAVAAYEAEHPEDFEESCRKPITEATEIPSDDYYVITTTEGTTRFYIKKIDFGFEALPEEPYDWFTTDLSNAQIFSSAKQAGEYFAERKLADNVFALGPNNRRVRFYDYVKTPYECWLIDTGVVKESCERKPIPEGMTIEQLVEEMEENEDTVECAWCNDLFDKSECRYEVGAGGPDDGLGWLCSRCEMAIKSRGETLTFRENNYWDFLDEDAELHDLGNEYDGGYPATQTWVCYFDDVDIGTVEATTEDEALEKMQHEYPEYPYSERKHDDCWWVEPAADNLVESTLTEAAGFDCPKLREADNNQPGIAKFKILYQFRKNPNVQGPYGDCPYLSGVGKDATFRGLSLEDTTRHKYGNVQDLELADNGEVMLTTTSGKKYSLRHALRIASPATDKFSNTRKVLLAIKAAAEAAEKTLDTKTVRNLRVRNALEKLDDTVADEFKAHIKNITFRIPAHNAYSANDILDIDPDASEQQAELAAERINRIHDAFYSLPFAKQAEAEGMVEERIPAENVGWILSSWGAVGKIRFDCPISSLSNDAQDIIKKAKLSEDKVKTEAFEVDCYRLATELIRFFGNDPKFYEKPVESKELVATAVDEAFDLDFPEV